MDKNKRQHLSRVNNNANYPNMPEHIITRDTYNYEKVQYGDKWGS